MTKNFLDPRPARPATRGIVSRRNFVAGLSALTVAGCSTTGGQRLSYEGVQPSGLAAMYGPRPNEKFPVPAVKLSQVPRKYLRREVAYQTKEKPGTLIVDTGNRFLYLVEGNDRALRYGIGVGRQGFDWSGRGRIGWKRKWPVWTPPKEMIERQPELAKYAEGMEPGLSNPLGSRALYIMEGNKDTLYRVHGTAEAYSIGRAVSSGCVRMLNQDVMDLYERVRNGAGIIVLAPGEALV